MSRSLPEPGLICKTGGGRHTPPWLGSWFAWPQSRPPPPPGANLRTQASGSQEPQQGLWRKVGEELPSGPLRPLAHGAPKAGPGPPTSLSQNATVNRPAPRARCGGWARSLERVWCGRHAWVRQPNGTELWGPLAGLSQHWGFHPGAGACEHSCVKSQVLGDRRGPSKVMCPPTRNSRSPSHVAPTLTQNLHTRLHFLRGALTHTLTQEPLAQVWREQGAPPTGRAGGAGPV